MTGMDQTVAGCQHELGPRIGFELGVSVELIGGARLDSMADSEPTRNERLAEQSRMWSAWAGHAITDTPPDIYKGETIGEGTAASEHFGGGTVATDNVWIVDGEFLTAREWSTWEHRNDPPEWGMWPRPEDGDT